MFQRSTMPVLLGKAKGPARWPVTVDCSKSGGDGYVYGAYGTCNVRCREPGCISGKVEINCACCAGACVYGEASEIRKPDGELDYLCGSILCIAEHCYGIPLGDPGDERVAQYQRVVVSLLEHGMSERRARVVALDPEKRNAALLRPMQRWRCATHGALGFGPGCPYCERQSA